MHTYTPAVMLGNLSRRHSGGGGCRHPCHSGDPARRHTRPPNPSASATSGSACAESSFSAPPPPTPAARSWRCAMSTSPTCARASRPPTIRTSKPTLDYRDLLNDPQGRGRRHRHTRTTGTSRCCLMRLPPARTSTARKAGPPRSRPPSACAKAIKETEARSCNSATRAANSPPRMSHARCSSTARSARSPWSISGASSTAPPNARPGAGMAASAT